MKNFFPVLPPKISKIKMITLPFCEMKIFPKKKHISGPFAFKTMFPIKKYLKKRRGPKIWTKIQFQNITQTPFHPNNYMKIRVRRSVKLFAKLQNFDRVVDFCFRHEMVVSIRPMKKVAFYFIQSWLKSIRLLQCRFCSSLCQTIERHTQ